MKHLKMIGLLALAAMALAALTAGTASATTLEVAGVPKDESVELTASLAPETSLLLQPTGGGSLANTCKTSHVDGHTAAPYTGHEVEGPVTSLTFAECASEGVEVVEPGSLSITHITGTTNGTVTSRNAEVKVPSPIGTLTCRTGTGTDIGTLTGTGNTNDHAIMDINAVLNCGFFLPSAEWKGTYVITSPTGLGVTDTPPPEPATTLEVGGVTKSEEVAITASLAPETSLLLQPTGGGSLANTCKTSHVDGHTAAPYTGHEVEGPVTSLTFAECASEGVEVVEPGSLSITHITGTTNGTVTSRNAEVKVPSPIGTLTCRTGTGTDLGTLTGKAGSQHAIMDINAVLNCGFFLPSAEWKGEYIVTSPTGLGVSA